MLEDENKFAHIIKNYFINIIKTVNYYINFILLSIFVKALNKSQVDRDRFEDHISIKNKRRISRNYSKNFILNKYLAIS